MTDIDTTRWEHVAWMCPRCGDSDGLPSRLQLVDSRELSVDSHAVWENGYDSDLYHQVKATETEVYCADCETVFDVSFDARENE